MGDVLEAVELLASEWRRLCTQLRLKYSTLDVIESNNPRDVHACLYEALVEWLQLNYDYQRHGRPSWRRLAEAVSSLDGALAEKISIRHMDSETMRSHADHPLHLGKPIKEGSVDYQELDKAMKEGIVDYQGIDTVLVGVGGAGKTHTLAMILNEPLPDKRVSTPCTKPPVRTVTIGEDGGMLKRVEGEQYFSMVAITVREVAHSLPPTSQPPVARISPVEHCTHELEEKILRYLQEDPEEDGMPVQIHRPLYKLRWNRLTDSGGQHQFLEVLTIFLHHISLGIFVIKLNERLDAFPMIEFYNHAGNSVGTPYKSRYSQEQVIRHFMRALISQGGKMGVKFLFIGTHRDRMEESKDESIQDKNEKLKKIIMAFNMKDNVIYSRVRNPIFAINAKTPDDNDLKVMKQVRSELVKSANVPSIPIPIRSEVCVCVCVCVCVRACVRVYMHVCSLITGHGFRLISQPMTSGSDHSP